MTDLLRTRSAADIRTAAERYRVDPLPDAPAGDHSGVAWLYAPGQYELALLHRLVEDGFAANRFVHYAPNYGEIRSSARFRRAPGAGSDADDASVCIVGSGEITVVALDEAEVVTVAAGTETRLPGNGDIELRVTVPAGTPATIAILPVRAEGVTHDEASRAGAALDRASEWEVWNGSAWVPPTVRHGSRATAAHDVREHTVSLPMQPVAAGRYDLPAPVLGRPVIVCVGKPVVATGESLDEAVAVLNGTATAESRHDLVQREDGHWTTVHELGFRHLAIAGADVTEVTVEASAHPVATRGAFVCSDDRLNEIWAASAYTLRLCMQGLMVDGIKRDRMPWIGDQALNTLSNAYAFADGRIVRDSLIALGQHRHGYVNGISDYSLWWVINAAFTQLHFGGTEQAHEFADAVHEFVAELANHTSQEGIFRPSAGADGFTDAGAGSVLLDWGVTVEEGRDLTALQMLWYWALRSASGLLAAAEHEGAARWNRLAETLAATLRRTAWDAEAGAWREYLERSSPCSAYPNFLAVLSGMSAGPVPVGVRSVLMRANVGTPFMTAFALRALADSGEPDEAIRRIRTLWGGMLDVGARTFWEKFDGAPGERYAMYGRPFGKSLCHAWSAGPAALLPSIVLGVRPVSDGWTRFEVDPRLGDLEWAEAVVPTPHGDLCVMADAAGVTVDVPAGATLVRDDVAHEGPTRVTWSSMRKNALSSPPPAG